MKMMKLKVHKDGYGAHWHAVGWLAAITIVISGSTMTLSASAQSTAVTPSTLLRGINDLKAQLSRVEDKIDRLTTTCTGSGAPASCPASSANQVPANTITTDRAEVVPGQTKTAAPTTDVTKCRQSCEDDFNACASVVKQEMQYVECKVGYESCWTKCGQ
jgi:hypothetical protein